MSEDIEIHKFHDRYSSVVQITRKEKLDGVDMIVNSDTGNGYCTIMGPHENGFLFKFSEMDFNLSELDESDSIKFYMDKDFFTRIAKLWLEHVGKENIK